MGHRLPLGAPVEVNGKEAIVRGVTFGVERYDVMFKDGTISTDLPRHLLKPLRDAEGPP